ncbi:MAG: molybdopterin cofactor-binding domain-containing protein, partial [Kofleriaceae bacterium]
MIDPTRRGFLAGTGALTLAVAIGCGGDSKGTRIRHAEASGEFKANLYITVMPDGRIGLVVNKAEFGQGVGTAYATLAAEELGVAVDQIDVEYAGSHKDMRTSFGMQVTGGSTSTAEGYKAVRKSAASAREMLVAAAAASWKVPTSQCSVGGGKVLHAASARAIGYGDLTKLAARESVPSKPKLKAVKDFTVIGKHDRRVDARSKVDGTAKFGIDTVVPNMVNAYVIHGPVFGARATKVSADAARKRPGVIDIFAFAGGVAVVADKYWQAMAAAREVEVTWSPGEVSKLDTEEMQRAMRAYDDDGTSVKDSGNAGKALGRAKTKLRAIYEAPYLCHAPLEPQNCTVSVIGKTAEVWAPNQSATVVQAFVSDAVGIAFENVKVHTTLLGGGFGRRLVADACAQAAIISQRVKRPVKLVWSRESDMTQAFYRPVYSVHFEGAVDDGRVTALRTHCISQSILLSSAETM